MTKITGTPIRTVRMDDSLWKRFGKVADDRSAVLRAFIHWYIGDEGWPMPTRKVEPITEAEDSHSGA